MRISNFGVNALKLTYLLYLQKNNPTPPLKQNSEIPQRYGCKGMRCRMEKGGQVPPRVSLLKKEELGGAHLAPLVPIALDSIFDADPWKLTVRGFIKWGHRIAWILALRIPRSAEFLHNDIPIVYLSGSSSEGGSFCYDTPFCIFHGHDIMAISFPTFQQTFKHQSISITHKVTP